MNVLNPMVEIESEFSNFNNEVSVKCKYCQKQYKMLPRKLLNGQVHYSGDSRVCIRPKQLSFDWAIKHDIEKRIAQIYQNTSKKFELLSYYVDESTPIHLRCLKCGEELFELPIKLRKQNFCCQSCSNRKRIEKIKNEVFDGRDTGIKRKFTTECKYCVMTGTYTTCSPCRYLESKTYLIDEFYDMVHPDIILKSNYVHKYEPMDCECRKCGSVWKARPIDLIKGCGCQRCNASKGESLVEACLESENINYIREYHFDDCRYKLPLRFDFFLPDYNAAIEYDGKQHYEPTSFHGEDADEAYLGIKTRDKIKNEYCRKNNIKLLRIKYNDMDIQGSIKRFLKRLKAK